MENLNNFIKKTQLYKEECLALAKEWQIAKNHNLKTGESDIVSIATNDASINGKEEPDESMEQMHSNEMRPKLMAMQLLHLARSLNNLRLKLSLPIEQLDDPLFEVFKFLKRKQLAHSIQLTNCRFHAIICSEEEHWPKFRFGRFSLYTDEDLKRTTKYWLFKNRKELKAPSEELVAILATLDAIPLHLDANNKKLLNPIQMVHHYDTSDSQSKDVYFFVNLDEKDMEDKDEDEEIFDMLEFNKKQANNRLFIHLPNKIETKMGMAATIYWCRQLSKVHFNAVHFEHYRWSAQFMEFLSEFGLTKFLPISADSFKTYNPVTINFLKNAIRATSCTMWDMRGTADFLHYLVGEQTKCAYNGHKRMPESFRVWGFIPQPLPNQFALDEAESSFFDVLIQHAKTCMFPGQMIHRIDFNFKQEPVQWIKVSGLQLIYKCQTYKVDEEDGTENETLEVRYQFKNANGEQKFQVHLECEPGMFNQQMYSFTLILEEAGNEE